MVTSLNASLQQSIDLPQLYKGDDGKGDEDDGGENVQCPVEQGEAVDDHCRGQDGSQT